MKTKKETWIILLLVFVVLAVNGQEVDTNMIQTSTPEQIKELIKTLRDINSYVAGGRTLLMLVAALNENPEVAQVVIDAGADINAQDGSERRLTPLMFAAYLNENPEVTQTLIEERLYQ